MVVVFFLKSSLLDYSKEFWLLCSCFAFFCCWSRTHGCETKWCCLCLRGFGKVFGLTQGGRGYEQKVVVFILKFGLN